MKLSQDQQNRLVLHIRDLFSDYDNQTKQWRDRMLKIYKNVTSFVWEGQNGDTNFKVNKGHEIENKILPRIVARSPKPIVSFKSDEYLVNEGEVESYNKRANAVQDKLQRQFEKQDIKETLRLVAKSGVRYGIGFAKVKDCYRINRSPKKVEKTYVDEMGNETPTIERKVDEKVYEYYSAIEIKSWADMYFDPRYTRMEDMPAIIELKRNIRLSYFSQSPDKSKYMNLDTLVELASASSNSNFYQQKVSSLLGIDYDERKIIKPSTLEVKCFYGYFDLKDNDDMSGERMYEVWTINDTVVVYAREISYLPFEDFRVFEDTEQYCPTGFIESSLGLQDEMNFKKNKASEYINKALNRNWIVGVGAGIDARKLAGMKQGEIIMSTKSSEDTMKNIMEIPHRQLPSDYFQEQNDIDRQIQTASFTIDTTAPKSNQSLTNTATGIKIQDRDTSYVIDQARGNFEDFVGRLSYKFLLADYENMDENTRVKKVGEDGFREINKEAIKDAVERYEIKIEAGSSSYDSIESRRSDAIAVWNIGMQAMQAGIPVNLKEQYERIMNTFEGIDTSKLFEEVQQQPQGLPELPPGM